MERVRLAVRLLIAIGVGVGVGAATAFGQGALSDASTSLANSAGPWCVAAFLVARHNRRFGPAIVGAMLTLACCELGYVLANELRSVASARSTVVFWLTAAIFAGPPVGVAGYWSTQSSWRRGTGLAVLGGVLLGEGVYGWSTVSDTTDWRYWALEATIGAFVIVGAAVRTRRPIDATLSLVAGLATAAVVLLAGRLA